MGGGGEGPVGPNVAFSLTIRTKIISTGHVFWAKIYQKCIYGGATLQTPMGELTALLIALFGGRFVEGR